MNNKTLATVLATFFLSPFAAAEERLSYSYAELGYNQIELNDGAETSGYNFKTSIAINQNFFVLADINNTSGDINVDNTGKVNFDLESTEKGYGFNSDQVDGSSWYISKTKTNLTNDTVEGEYEVKTIRLGLRSLTSNQLEFNASYTQNDIEDSPDESGYQLGMVYKMSETLHFVADYETLDGDFGFDSITISVRNNF